MSDLAKSANLHRSAISVETVLGCNLSCPACLIGINKINRKKGMMSLENFSYISDKVKPYVLGSTFYLHHWGEPMLNKHIYDMIGIASKYSNTNISTNANTLDVSSTKRLIESGVESVIFSIDGITQDVYEQYRRGGNVYKALSMLTVAAEHNRILGNPVRIIPQFCCFEHNEHQVEGFKTFCANIGLSASIKPPFIKDGVKPAKNENYVRHVEQSREKRIQKMRGCRDMLDNIVILLDGSVTMCCCDHDAVTTFGNIFTHELEAIWQSEKYLSFTEKLLTGVGNEECLDFCVAY